MRYGEIVKEKPKTGAIFKTKEALQEFQQNTSRISNMLKYKKDLRENFGDKGSQMLIDAFNIMNNDMCAIDQGAEWEPDEAKARVVRDGLNFLLRIVTDAPHTPIVKDMGIELGVLAYNWNMVTIKNGQITTLSQACERFARLHLTVMDLMDKAIKLMKKYDDLLKHSPPAFELSRHYLQTLDPEK